MMGAFWLGIEILKRDVVVLLHDDHEVYGIHQNRKCSEGLSVMERMWWRISRAPVFGSSEKPTGKNVQHIFHRHDLRGVYI